ncbi:MAG: iron ABC transporter permease [Erysipelotrichaceae bacterium]|nr:iron ABC transporter permease [Erysipelotrichaceae bacterium]
MSSRLKWTIAIGILLLLLGMLLSIQIGAKDISTSEILKAFFQFEGTMHDQLIMNVRLPRMLAGVFVGGLLAMSGSMMQGVMRNPLADPSLLGVNQGATLMVAISSVLWVQGGVFTNFFMALLGACISGGCILLFTIKNIYKQGITPILLAGTAMSMFFLSLASIVALIGNRSQELAFWIAGGFRQVTWDQLWLLLIVGSVCSLMAYRLASKINILSMGDEASISLGISPEKVKIKMILWMIPICAVCVAVAGNIGFVGLFIPHIMRKVIGNDYRILMPLSFLYGSIVLVFADIAARMLSAPYELPVGLFSACIGVPAFLILVQKEKR